MPNEMNQGHEIRSFVLLRVVKTIFFLNKQGQGLKALVAISTQTFLKCPPPPPPGEDYIAEVVISVFLICASGDIGLLGIKPQMTSD